MRYFQILIIIGIFSGSLVSQSIRKDHREMTQDERLAFASTLIAEEDLIRDLSVFHNANFGPIHFESPPTDIFLAWHRYMIFELEQKLQSHCPCISIPYWDWVTDNSTSSSLWNNEFLGQFNSLWSLGRSLGGGMLPTQTDINTAQAITNWDDYTANLESVVVHVGGHGWVGGVMNSGASPLDPVFYLHHGMVDKLWHDWSGVSGNNANYVRTNMNRYDGSFQRFDGVTLPSIDPDDIKYASSLGVFFAENQNVTLSDYSVSNTHRGNEVFFYQYPINVGNEFIVPDGKSAEIISSESVVLGPGTTIESGSNTRISINTCNFSDYRSAIPNTQNSHREKLSGNKNTESTIEITQTSTDIVVNSLASSIEEVRVFSMDGKCLFTKGNIGDYRLSIQTSDFPSGIYSVIVKNQEKQYFTKLIFKL